MSRLFEKYQEEQHHLNDVLQRIIDTEYQYDCYLLDQWKEEKRNPETSTITEWEYLGKPNKKNTILKKG